MEDPRAEEPGESTLLPSLLYSPPRSLPPSPRMFRYEVSCCDRKWPLPPSRAPFPFSAPTRLSCAPVGGGGGPVRRVGPRECVGPGVVGLIREQGAGFRGRDVLSVGRRGELASVLWWGGPVKYLNQTYPSAPPREEPRRGQHCIHPVAFLEELSPGKAQSHVSRSAPGTPPHPPLQLHRPTAHRQPSGQGGLDLPFDWSRRLFTKEGSELGGGVSCRSSFWASEGDVSLVLVPEM